ncbi:MAG: efflux RND transporter periplasmic adaptor subunit [Thermodesulfobacteriota bacterium]
MYQIRYLVLAVVIILIVSAALWFYFRSNQVDEGVLEANGQVRGIEITISSNIPGRLDKVPINEGQQVKKDDLIAEISSEEIQARIEQANAQVEIYKKQQDVAFHSVHEAKAALQRVESTITEVESRLNLASSDYERSSQLADKGIISRRQLEEAETQFKSAQANVDAAIEAKEEAIASIERAEASQEVIVSQLASAVAQLKEINATFEDTKIYAPSDGTVINKLVEQGELVVQGTPIAVIIDLSDIYVRVYIPQIDIGKIRIGNPARIYADSFPDRFFGGRVTEVSQEAEFTPKEVHVKEERTKLVFGVKVQIENPQGYLKPGMPVDVKIKWDEDAPW